MSVRENPISQLQKALIQVIIDLLSGGHRFTRSRTEALQGAGSGLRGLGMVLLGQQGLGFGQGLRIVHKIRRRQPPTSSRGTLREPLFPFDINKPSAPAADRPGTG